MVDEIDEKIIKTLMENSRNTYVEIGSIVGLSEGAVRNRVQALVNSGAIRKFTVEVAPSIRVRSLTMISVDPSTPTYTLSKKMEALSGIESIYEVTGEYDIVCVVSQRDIEGLNQTIEEIRKLDGVVKTNTVIVLRTL
ncbi:MAG: Lrp/AsnC family transcriptional regulator [Candidatus Bathyarchaeota archaeon]|nr:Lrp/AsnC family transcriptional regulator [Candidatus Bathyarchaeota archaeon]